MNWTDVELCFSRAITHAFSKKKMMLTFPVLALCGLLVVFCKALAFDASRWMAMSLVFLPMLLSSGILLGLGVLLIRIHLHEIKGLHLSFRRLISGSADLIMGTTYLSIPLVLIYLLLWMALGIFFLLGELPGIGPFFRVVLAFGPFLLILGSVLLCLVNLALLFFVSPAAAIQPLRGSSLLKRILALFERNLLASIVMFVLALVPLIFVVSLLGLSAMLTHFNSAPIQSAAIAIEWFFIMVPFTAILSPAVIFFFNFAAESHQLLRVKSI